VGTEEITPPQFPQLLRPDTGEENYTPIFLPSDIDDITSIAVTPTATEGRYDDDYHYDTAAFDRCDHHQRLL
jgi:hypothetical protein